MIRHLIHRKLKSILPFLSVFILAACGGGGGSGGTYVGEVGGSISAEHGIGMLKRAYLGQSRNTAELALMRTLKQALDPKNILNPGRVFSIQANDLQ